jgi:hypothetical protein
VGVSPKTALARWLTKNNLKSKIQNLKFSVNRFFTPAMLKGISANFYDRSGALPHGFLPSAIA